MFDDLDDPNDLTLPPVTAVMRRGRAWRARRTSALVGAGAIVLAGATGSLAFALHDSTSHDVRVASPVPTDTSTSSLVPTTATPLTAVPTVVDTSTTVAPVTTPSSSPSTPPTTPTPDTTPGTAHGGYDWTALTVAWDSPGALTVKSGGSTTLGYTIMNRGSWPVVIPNDPSPDCVVGNFPQPPEGPDDAMWPGPVSDNWEWCTPTSNLTLAPGASVHYVDDVKGFATPPGGTPIPLRPGPSQWTPRPWQYPCGPAPCDRYRGASNTVAMKIVAGDAPPFEAYIWETHATVPIGGKFVITASYANKLGDKIAVFIPGPCWKSLPPIETTCESGGAVFTFPPNSGIKFQGDLYPTSDMTATGKPLGPGTYKWSIDGSDFTLTVTKD